MTAIRLGTCVLIAVAVLSFGGVESWGNAALEVGAALLFVLWAALVTLRGRAEICWNWLFIPVFGLGVIALVQYAFGASVYPYLTKIELLRWSAYALLFFLAVQSFQTKEHVKQFIWFLLSLGFVVSLFGLVQYFTFNGKLYWCVYLPAGVSPFGPFVNPNHFAGFVELIAPLGVGDVVFPVAASGGGVVIVVVCDCANWGGISLGIASRDYCCGAGICVVSISFPGTSNEKETVGESHGDRFTCGWHDLMAGSDQSA